MVQRTGKFDGCINVNNIKAQKAVAYNYDVASVCFYLALNWSKIYLTIYPDTYFARH